MFVRYFAFALLFLAAPAAAQVKVVASFSILADMAREIGGGRVEVRSLVGPDADAHVYLPTPSDARAIAQADIAIVNGLGFEGWLDRLIAASGYRGPVVVATDGAPTRRAPDRHGHGHSHGKAEPDPHAWQNLANAVFYVRNIAEGLAKVDAAGAAEYRANADRYAARLAAIDSWVKAEIAKIPIVQRRAITSHDAFGHFAAAYGIRFLSPSGLSTDSEPTAGQMTRLIRQIKTEKVRAVFVENMSNPRAIEQIGRETGAVVGGKLYADALSKSDGPAATYEAMFRHNVGTLVAALRGPGS